MKSFVPDQLYPTGDLSQKPAHWSCGFTYKTIPQGLGAGSAALPGAAAPQISVWDRGQAAATASSSLGDLLSWERGVQLSRGGVSWLMGLCSLEMFWVIFVRQGRKWAGVPWLGEALEGLSRDREGKKGKRTEHCPTQCFVSSRIKLSGNMTCFYRSYSNCMHVLKTRKVMKKYLIIGTSVSQLVCMGFTILQTRRTWIRFSLSFKVAFFKTDICAQFCKTICFIENTCCFQKVAKIW